MRCNAMEESYEEAEFLGKPALYTDSRVDKATVPEGFHRYEIRHADDDWGEPCQLGYGILVNCFGTLITNEAIQLGPDGRMDINPGDMNFPTGECLTLADYMEEHPAVEKPVFEVVPVAADKADWLYSDPDKDKERGVIGHIRGDFGSGKEFWTTWWPHQNELNKQPFKSELDAVVNWLRQDFGPLKSLDSMARFCQLRAHDAKLEHAIPAYGFQVETPNHQYFLRCNPTPKDYNFYIYCTDKAAQREHARETPKQERPSVLTQLKAKANEPPKSKAAPAKRRDMEL